jgi:hypothetical protein
VRQCGCVSHPFLPMTCIECLSSQFHQACKNYTFPPQQLRRYGAAAGTRTTRWTLRAPRACGVTPPVRRIARDARSFAICGRRATTWAGAASSAGTGSCIPVRALTFGGRHFLPFHTVCARACSCAWADTGDPLRYHSHFVATVQPSPSAPLRPMEIVAHGRLGLCP